MEWSVRYCKSLKIYLIGQIQYLCWKSQRAGQGKCLGITSPANKNYKDNTSQSVTSNENPTVYYCSFLPLAFVNRTVGPTVLSIAILYSFVELTYELVFTLFLVVEVCASSSTMHKAIYPRPIVLVVSSSLLSFTKDFIFFKLALKKTARLLENQLSKPIFVIIFESSHKLSTIRETLFPLTFFLAVFPLALIVTIVFCVKVFTIAIGFVVVPLSFIIAAIFISHNPHSLLRITMPVTNIVERFTRQLTVLIKHDAVSVSGCSISLSQKHTLPVYRCVQITSNIPVLRYSSYLNGFLNVWIFFEKFFSECALLNSEINTLVFNSVLATVSPLQQVLPIYCQNISNKYQSFLCEAVDILFSSLSILSNHYKQLIVCLLYAQSLQNFETKIKYSVSFKTISRVNGIRLTQIQSFKAQIKRQNHQMVDQIEAYKHFLFFAIRKSLKEE